MKVICYLFLLFLTFRCQLGGGGGGGGGGSYGGGTSVGNDSDYDGGSDDDHEPDCGENCFGIIFGTIGSLIVIPMIIICIKFCYEIRKVNKLKEKLWKNFISKNISNENSFQTLIEIISKWKMYYVQKEENKQVNLRNQNIQIINGTKNNKFPYLNIEIDAEDEYGPSKLKGVIIQMQDGLKILMFKDYLDKNRASQTGDYSILVYEGQTQNIEEGFSGSWYFHFKRDSNGTWMWRL